MHYQDQQKQQQRKGILPIYIFILLILSPQIYATELSDDDSCAQINCEDCPPDSIYDKESIDFDPVELPLELPLPLASKRFKRSTGMQSAETLRELCCPKDLCICQTPCPKVPTCPDDLVALQLTEGNDQPGSCCPSFKCGPRPTNSSGGVFYYYPQPCHKCESNSPERFCLDVCPPTEEPGGCRIDQYTLVKNGESWFEDHDCLSCVCANGDPQCTATHCDAINCIGRYVKRIDDCCPMCIEDLSQTELLSGDFEYWTRDEKESEETDFKVKIISSTSSPKEFTESSTNLVTKDLSSTTEEEDLVPTTERVELTSDHTESPGPLESSTISEYLPSPSTELNEMTTEQFEDISSSSQSSTSNELADELQKSTTEDPTLSTEKAGISTEYPEISSRSISSSFSPTTEDLTSSTNEKEEIETQTDNDDEMGGSIGLLETDEESSSSTTEDSLTTPTSLTPESTSYHKDPSITHYHVPKSIHNLTSRLAEPINSDNNYNLGLILGALMVLSCLLLLTGFLYWMRKRRDAYRKHYMAETDKQLHPLYSSKPNSDTNLSTNTNTVLLIDSDGEKNKKKSAKRDKMLR